MHECPEDLIRVNSNGLWAGWLHWPCDLCIGYIVYVAQNYLLVIKGFLMRSCGV